ncbi:MAG: glycosyltransferase family 2 protein [Leptospiraceae bacterium]|nr:glycosyltransferase family 2 protein [Leptospiraceae bacterium]MCB1170192.1 glycosyltransferase family 2 protein [Leptospiraceae bacterium]
MDANLSVGILAPLDDLDEAPDLFRILQGRTKSGTGLRTSSLLQKLPKCAALIPVLNEVENLEFVLRPLQELCLFNYIVCADNGSADGSPEKARELGALVSHCQRRGYGSTCLAGMGLLHSYPDWEILVFMDGDGSDDPEDLWSVLGPLFSGEADLCLGARTQGALLPHQKFGNWLATFLIRLLYKYRYRDLGPFRAIRRDALQALEMDDPDFGWTVQMQIRAVQRGLRICEVEVKSRKRHAGRSKVSATIKGSFLAGWIILRTVFREFLLNKKESRV